MSWRSGRAYSQDFRDKVLAAFDAGEPARDVAERFSVSVSYVYKADLRRRRTGDSSPGPQRCHLPLRLDAHRDQRARLHLDSAGLQLGGDHLEQAAVEAVCD
jgi:transposase